MEHQVRRLTPDDAEIFRAIRLESLKNHPEAFAASYEFEEGLALNDFADQLKKEAIFGAFQDGQLMGLAAFKALKSPKARHKGILWGMYLRESARGSGLGQALVERVIEHARSQVELVHLTVVTSNERALRFYKGLGFESFGTERKALKIGAEYYDEEFLVRYLD